MYIAELGVEHLGNTITLRGHKKGGKWINWATGVLTAVSHGLTPGHTSVKLSKEYCNTKEQLNVLLEGTTNAYGTTLASGTKSTWRYDTAVEIVVDASELK